MARIRTIKPEFWTDGDIMDLTPYARLLFIGSWNFALCDFGHVADDPRRLKMQVLPADDVDGNALVQEIVDKGRMVRITVDGRSFLHIKRFTDHQKTEKRWTPRCPVCAVTQPRQTSPNLSETPPTSAPERKGKERKGKEGGTASRALALDTESRPDVDHLCDLLADSIQDNGSKRPTITKSWRDSCRLMIDKDGRTIDEIRGAIVWSQADEFWRANILSMPKLRDKYDQLRLAAQRPARGGRQQETDALFDRAMARARAMGEGA
jgi:hypothetical protein